MTHSCNGKCRDQPNKSWATPLSIDNLGCRTCKKVFPGLKQKSCPCCGYPLAFKSRVYGHHRSFEVIRI